MINGPDLEAISDEGINSESHESYADAEQRRLFEKEESGHKREQQTRKHIQRVSLGLWL